MQMTSDRQLDWNAVPDVGGKLPSGIVQLRIMDWEEKQTNAEGLVEKGERAGQPKIAKLMYVAHFEGVAPEEAVGLKWSEYYVFGSDLDPQAYQQQTIYDSIGARQAKKLLADAQVPWSSSLVGTFSASIGAMVLLKVDHKKEKRRDIDEYYVACKTGRSYKVGEAHPQYMCYNFVKILHIFYYFVYIFHIYYCFIRRHIYLPSFLPFSRCRLLHVSCSPLWVVEVMLSLLCALALLLSAFCYSHKIRTPPPSCQHQNNIYGDYFCFCHFACMRVVPLVSPPSLCDYQLSAAPRRESNPV